MEIVKDAAGEPTGVFVEHNLIQVLEFTLLREVPRFTHADRLRALYQSQLAYARRGVDGGLRRSWHRAGGAGGLPRSPRARLVSPAREPGGEPDWEGPVEAATAMRDVASWAGGRGLGDDRLRVAGICLHYGGDAEVARILHEAQPYTGWAGFVESANAREAYALQATLAARLGLRVNTLVTRCLPEVLEAWEAIDRAHPIRDLRWVLVHLNAATPEQLRRIRALGLVVTTNPISYLYRSAGDEVARLGGAADQLLPHLSLPPPAHPVRHRHRQQAGRSLDGLRRRRGPARHAYQRDRRAR